MSRSLKMYNIGEDKKALEIHAEIIKHLALFPKKY